MPTAPNPIAFRPFQGLNRRLSQKQETVHEKVGKRTKALLPSPDDTILVLLDKFWKRLEKSFERSYRLALLKEYDAIRLTPRTGKALKVLRDRFNDKKALYFNKDRCEVCCQLATARHHIIELQHGGTNHGINLIALCGYCHSLVHPWLAEKKPSRISA